MDPHPRVGGDIDVASGATVCVSLVRGSPATTFSGPHPAGWYSTEASGAPCDPTETYNVSADDDELRVQVRVASPVTIQAVFFSVPVSIDAQATMQSEFAS